jgi:hypothetical protein
MALAKLMNDNTLSGAYPASLAAADEGRGIAASGKTTFEYTYTAVGNAYCLTARSGNSAVAPYHISNTESSPQSGACTGHSVTGNLVINGRGENGNNTNFSVLTYDSADSPPGATGSFAANTGAYLMICNDQRISVDPAKRYKLTGSPWGRIGGIVRKYRKVSVIAIFTAAVNHQVAGNAVARTCAALGR